MKNFLIALTIFFMWSVFGIWFYSCQVKHLCHQTNVNSSDTTTVDSIIDTVKVEPPKNIDSIITIKDNTINDLLIHFKTDSITYPSTIDSIYGAFFKYLNNHQNEELVVTGLNTPEEDIDLGIKRAEMFKKGLVAFGINENRITTEGQTKSFDFVNTSYKNGILYDYKTITKERRTEIEKNIVSKILYASFASKEFQPDNTLKAYAYELKEYLEKYPEKNIEIIGHTDNVGDADANLWIGQQRANNVKKYLISQGISSSKIISTSKGESSPFESNATKAGRKKNRRIEININ